MLPFWLFVWTERGASGWFSRRGSGLILNNQECDPEGTVSLFVQQKTALSFWKPSDFGMYPFAYTLHKFQFQRGWFLLIRGKPWAKFLVTFYSNNHLGDENKNQLFCNARATRSTARSPLSDGFLWNYCWNHKAFHKLLWTMEPNK